MENCRIISLLHHPVKVYRNDGKVITIMPSGDSVRTARVIIWGPPRVAGTCMGVDIIERDRGHVNPLYVPEPGTYYLVSSMTARELCHPQFISPNTVDRDQRVGGKKGLKGVRSFQRFRKYDETV